MRLLAGLEVAPLGTRRIGRVGFALGIGCTQLAIDRNDPLGGASENPLFVLDDLGLRRRQLSFGDLACGLLAFKLSASLSELARRLVGNSSPAAVVLERHDHG